MTLTISRRSLVRGSAGVAAGLSLSGAASSTYAAPSLIQSTSSDAEITLWTAFGSGVNGDAQAKLVDDFNASGTGVTVTSLSYASYEEVAQALITGLQIGDVPDVATLAGIWWFRFYLSQSIVDLTPFLTDEVKVDDFVEPLYVEYQRNGGQYALPFARSTPLLYFNQDALDSAGLDSSIFKTWSGLVDAAPDYMAGSNLAAAFGFGSGGFDTSWVLQGAVWAFEGNYSDEEFNILVTEPECVEMSEFMREFVQSGNAVTTTDPNTEFNTGGVGAILNSTGSLGNISSAAQFEVGTAFLPEEKQFGCCPGGSAFSIVAGGSEEKQQAAFAFMEFCTNTESTSYWAQTTGYMPVRTSAIESPDFQAFLEENPNHKVAIDQLPKTQTQDSVRLFVPTGAQFLNEGFEQILVNNVPSSDAWAQIKETLDQEKQPVLEALAELEG